MVLIDEGASNVTLERLNFWDSPQSMVINCKHGTNVHIQNCAFDNVGGPAIQVRIIDDVENPVENLWITGCRINGSGETGIHAYRTHNLFVTDNVVQNCQKGGISIQNGSERVVCANNTVRSNGLASSGGNGLYIGGVSNALVTGNMVVDNGGAGLEAASSPTLDEPPRSPRWPRFIVTDNVFVGNGTVIRGSGIYITGHDHVVGRNLCLNNGSDGIQVGYASDAHHIVIQGNVVGNNNRSGFTSALWGSGIAVTAATQEFSGLIPDDQFLLIQNNLVYSDQQLGSNAQLHAIYCGLSPANQYPRGILIEGNRVYGPEQPLVVWDSDATNIVVRRNTGFRTEAAGQVEDGSLAFGEASSGLIELDLTSYLDVFDVLPAADLSLLQVTPVGGTGYAASRLTFWVAPSTTSDTTVEINWETDASTPLDDVQFNWRYGTP
jgi:parallel beta-helix repeat protein